MTHGLGMSKEVVRDLPPGTLIVALDLTTQHTTSVRTFIKDSYSRWAMARIAHRLPVTDKEFDIETGKIVPYWDNDKISDFLGRNGIYTIDVMTPENRDDVANAVNSNWVGVASS